MKKLIDVISDKMISNIKILPSEIFLYIFSYLSWDELIPSFWSLNERFDSLIYSAFSTNQCGIVINQPGLSYERFLSKLFPLIANSSLTSLIQHIHLDGTNSNACDFFNNYTNILRYPNLKSLTLTQCHLSPFLFETLDFLIKYQLEKFTLTIDEDILTTHSDKHLSGINTCDQGKEFVF